jgi:hypothetical protein
MPAAAILGIMTGFNASTAVTQTTPVTPSNNLVGGAAGVNLVLRKAGRIGLPDDAGCWNEARARFGWMSPARWPRPADGDAKVFAAFDEGLAGSDFP